MIELTSGSRSLALHQLSDASGPALLCLHALGSSAAEFAGVVWPGRVFALDFSGHGRSDTLRGGAYSPETIASDSDAALAKIGPAFLAGAGIGAYVALLLAGARRDTIPAALLLPGAGLAGGGDAPDWSKSGHDGWCDLSAAPPGCDPAVLRLDRDLRPPDYAQAFAAVARCLFFGDIDVAPPWWDAAKRVPAARPAPSDRTAALALLASLLD
jgi:pimeloyl-ACP methyl ester carboxylesterase